MAFIQHHPDPTLSPEARADVVERVDIIAVHGLESDSFTSSVTPLNSRKLWIRDFLPKYIRHSRILAYKYDSESAFSHETTNDTLQYFGREFLTAIYNHRVTDPRRPIIILAYSLGGLVVKAALAQASIDRRHASIVESIYGILLFGTPLQRLPSSSSLRFVISDISQKLLLPLPKARSPFRPSSLDVPSLTHPSLRFSDNYKTWAFEWGVPAANSVSCSHISFISFYEGIGQHDSHGLEIYKSYKRVSRVMLSKDHRNLCRFSSEDDLDFKIVVDKLHSLSDEAVNSVPYRKDIDFFDIRLLRKLYTPNNEIRKDRAAYRYPGTCEWILSHPSFLRWQSAINAVLWITGKPGTGKSTLACFVVDTLGKTSYGTTAPPVLVGDSTNLQVRPSHGRTISVAYFCDYNSPPTSAVDILRSLVHQLLSNEPSLLNYINPNEKLRCNDLAAELPLLGRLFTRFSELVKVFVIIDAVDELNKSTLGDLLTALDIQCTHSKDLASSLPDHDPLSCGVPERQSSMNVMITSRSDTSHWDFADPSSGFPVSHIDLSLSSAATSIASDLELLVDGYLSHFPLKKHRAQEKEESLRDILVKKAHGSFLWSGLVFQQLVKNSNHFSIHRLPTNLDLVYTQILGSISSDLEKEAWILLRWIMYAKRPLTVSELREAIQIDESIGHSSSVELDRTQQYRPHIPKSVQHLNGLLIEVHDSTIYFIHQSVRDFLLSREFYTYSEANFRLASSCMNYLVHNNLYSDRSDCIFEGDTLKQPATLDSQFLHYAALFWFDHFASIADGMDKLNFQLDILEDPKSVSFQFWFRYFWIFNTELWERKRFPKYLTKLTVLAFIGDVQTLGRQLDHGSVSVDECTPAGEEWTPLMAAAWIGDLAVVDLLCQHHAGVSAGPKRNSLTLYYAIERGHIGIAHKLILHFLDIYSYDAGHHMLDWPGPSCLTPLAISILNGHEKISRLLLRSGANINHPLGIVAKLDNFSEIKEAFSTPLTLAIFRRYDPEFIKFLIGAGGQVRNPYVLYTAARWATPSVPKLLLAAGASFEGSSEHWRSAILQAAILSGNQTKWELFIRLGKALSSIDLPPLIISNTSGKASVLKNLLEVRPEICFPISQPLHYSLKFGHYPITKLLLERRKATNSEMNAAYQALSSDEPPVPYCGIIPHLTEDAKAKSLEILLDHRLDVNLRDHRGNTPLHISASRRDVTAARLLVQHACEINAQNLAGQTAISIAASHGNTDLIQLLFDHGAEIDQSTLDNVLNSGCQEAVLTINSLLQHRAVSSPLQPLGHPDLKFNARYSYFNKAPENKFACAAGFLKSLQIDNLQDLLVSADDNFYYSNGFKSCLEDFTGMEWDWWPMSPRLHPLKRGQVWLKWRCYGGVIHMRKIPSSLAVEIRELQKYDLFLVDLGILDSHDPTPSVPLVGSLRGFFNTLRWLLKSLRFQLRRLAYSQEIAALRPQPFMPQSLPCTPVPTTATQFSQTTIQPNLPSIQNQAVTQSARYHSPLSPQRQRLRQYPPQNLGLVHVTDQIQRYLVVKACGEYDNIRIDQCNTDMEFFRILKHQYRKAKGRLRCWFSIFDIDHCNFDRYTKMRQNLIISDSKGTDSSADHYLPKPPDDLDYVYDPAEENPPISASVFKRNLKACPEQCFWPRFLHCCDAANDDEYSAYNTASSQSWPINGYLKLVPKRKEPWDIHGCGPGRAFGLTCFGRLGFFKLMVWFSITEIGPIIFWVLWLSVWDHSGDLQNASLPFMVVLGLWTMYVGSLGMNGPKHR